MLIIRKKNIYPLLIPTVQYVDRFKNLNSYVEMNPSLYIRPDGTFIVLVRTVNYLKYQTSFTIYDTFSNSVYFILKGDIKNCFDDYTTHILDVKYNIARQPSLWYGVEYIRFIDEKTVLACIPECNNSSPCIFKGELNENTLSSFVKCHPGVCEKNWMPCAKNKVIYSVCPFIIKSIVDDTKEEIRLNSKQLEDLNGWRGSSNGVEFSGCQLFLIHKNTDRVYSKWLLFNPALNTVQYSDDFTFFKDTVFEFVCSLASYANYLYVSIGVNDNKAFIIQIDPVEIVIK